MISCEIKGQSVYLIILYTVINIRPVKDFETLNYQYMKHLNRITNFRNPLKPFFGFMRCYKQAFF
jgi:hypothetical protein